MITCVMDNTYQLFTGPYILLIQYYIIHPTAIFLVLQQSLQYSVRQGEAQGAALEANAVLAERRKEYRGETAAAPNIYENGRLLVQLIPQVVH
jgi:hypothetical protein